MLQKWLNRLSKNVVLRILFFGAACLALLCFGIIGIGRDGQGGFDIKMMYIAGQAWLQGLNAYDPQIGNLISENSVAVSVERYDFAYPPQIAPLSLFLGLFSWEVVRWLMVGLNLIAVAALAYLCVRWVARPETSILGLKTSGYRWFILALVIGNPFTSHIVWMGQTTLIALAAMMGGWHFMRRDCPIIAGILITISTIKPQLSLLIVVWLLLNRCWLVLGSAAITGLIFCAVPMFISGPIQVWFNWFDGIAIYKSQPQNSLGFHHLFGIRNILAILDLPAPNLLPLALGFTSAMWWYRRKFIVDDILGILIIITLLFGFANDSYLVTLIPLIPSFWLHLHRRPKSQVIAIVLLVGLFFPQRFLRPLEIDLLLQFRVLIVTILGIWLVKLSWNQSRRVKIQEDNPIDVKSS